VFYVAFAQIVPSGLSYELEAIESFLNSNPDKSLQIIGYSNPANSTGETQALALQRVKAVRDALVEQGILPNRLQIAGLTASPPGVEADQPVWLSRCVEVLPVSPVAGKD
jgi:outer membrane protein OmpA-like peptidoglycan-associated protein